MSEETPNIARLKDWISCGQIRKKSDKQYSNKSINIFTITAQIHVHSLANVYRQWLSLKLANSQKRRKTLQLTMICDLN